MLVGAILSGWIIITVVIMRADLAWLCIRSWAHRSTGQTLPFQDYLCKVTIILLTERTLMVLSLKMTETITFSVVNVENLPNPDSKLKRSFD